jgi:hypothetical protein
VPPTYPSHVGGPNLQLGKIQFVTIHRNDAVVGASIGRNLEMQDICWILRCIVTLFPIAFACYT